MSSLLDEMGGHQFVHRTVCEFYQAIGKHLAPSDSSDHAKQNSRQVQFLSHALSAQPEPVYSSRASFLAQGLNPALFEALLEYLQARLEELEMSPDLSDKLVRTVGELYENCDEPLSMAS
ncbi:hypothetical protein ACNKU7_11765 [Microbulbifer sp. SA54]|uniref:hypothetical protein n=1 Tax=Microbulbifer sp. SA54 TaxID=3401577 RepID=UPI003AAD6BE6